MLFSAGLQGTMMTAAMKGINEMYKGSKQNVAACLGLHSGF